MTSAELKYLIAIDELYNGERGIKLTDIAQKMSVSKVSVYRAVERLERGGYVERDDKNKVVMTEHGKAQLEEYKVLTGWLACHLEHHCGVSGDIAYKDAIGAVCAMSDESRDGLFKFIRSVCKNSDCAQK